MGAEGAYFESDYSMIVSEVQSVTEPATRQRELNSMSLLTVTVVLATVTMTFGAMIAVFIIRSQAALYWGHLRVPPVLWASTVVLLASSVLLELARRELAHQNQRRFFQLTAWTTGLGALFLTGQLTAWLQVLHSGVVLAHNPHSWFIFLFSGLHGLHILLGLGGLAYLLVRTRTPASGPKYQMTTRAVANGVSLFWHYLDLLWVILFALLLLWRR
jgi:cytochrome c oxidase subunit 3